MAPAKFSTLIAATVSCFTSSILAASAVSSFSFRRAQIVGARVGFLVLLFLDGEDVGGALDAREQVGAVVGFQERIERFDALAR